MRLEPGRRADYAIRALSVLAHHRATGGRLTARSLAEQAAVSENFLPQILAELVRSGIVSGAAGRRGGYRLERDPCGITLLEVIDAVDGELTSTRCVLRNGPCRWDDVCAIHVPWVRAQSAVIDALDATSLAEVLTSEVEGSESCVDQDR